MEPKSNTRKSDRKNLRKLADDRDEEMKAETGELDNMLSGVKRATSEAAPFAITHLGPKSVDKLAEEADIPDDVIEETFDSEFYKSCTEKLSKGIKLSPDENVSYLTIRMNMMEKKMKESEKVAEENAEKLRQQTLRSELFEKCGSKKVVEGMAIIPWAGTYELTCCYEKWVKKLSEYSKLINVVSSAFPDRGTFIIDVKENEFNQSTYFEIFLARVLCGPSATAFWQYSPNVCVKWRGSFDSGKAFTAVGVHPESVPDTDGKLVPCKGDKENEDIPAEVMKKMKEELGFLFTKASEIRGKKKAKKDKNDEEKKQEAKDK